MSHDRADRGVSEEISLSLSASRDGELDLATQEELAGLVARDSAVAERAADFESVDGALKALGEAPLSDAKREKMLGEFESRLAELPQSQYSIVPLYWIAAAAAALVLGWVGVRGLDTSSSGGASQAPSLVERAPSPPRDGYDLELVEALGYFDSDPTGIESDEMAALAEEFLGLAPEDLEIIEALETLEYLAARDAGGQG